MNAAPERSFLDSVADLAGVFQKEGWSSFDGSADAKL